MLRVRLSDFGVAGLRGSVFGLSLVSEFPFSLTTTSLTISKPSTIIALDPLTVLRFECLDETEEANEVSSSEFGSEPGVSFLGDECEMRY